MHRLDDDDDRLAAATTDLYFILSHLCYHIKHPAEYSYAPIVQMGVDYKHLDTQGADARPGMLDGVPAVALGWGDAIAR